MTPVKYVTNKALLAEIQASKVSYSYFVEPHFAAYDAIAHSVSEITPDLIEAATKSRLRKATKAKTTPATTDIVIRVMTYDHIPLTDNPKLRSRVAGGAGHVKTNFPPFKHYAVREGELVEVGRSHWRHGLDNGEFYLDHGRITPRLGAMLMLLVERYSRRANFHGYSYREDMQSAATLQLSQVALQFNESKGDNPFAFYTTTARNAFVRILNIEKRNQTIRDDLLIMAGSNPSSGRQLKDAIEQAAASSEPKKPDRRYSVHK